MSKLVFISGDDYSALQFENAFRGTKVSDIIENPDEYQATDDGDEERYWELSVIEVGQVSDKFIEFVRVNIQDYDDSKTKNFYFEDEVIK